MALSETIDGEQTPLQERARFVSPIKMCAKYSSTGVELRPMRDSDLPWLYRVETHPAVIKKYRFRGATPTFEQFCHAVSQQVLAQFVIVSEMSGERVGHAFAYFHDMPNRTTYMAIVGSPFSENGKFALRGSWLLVSHLFHEFGMRKIYAEIGEFNLGGFRFFQSKSAWNPWEVEGLLKEEIYLDGRYWDKMVVAVRRERWLAAESFLVKRGLMNIEVVDPAPLADD